MGLTIINIMLSKRQWEVTNMFHVLFENHIYYIADITETHYVSYDDEGNRIWLPKEDCEVI